MARKEKDVDALMEETIRREREDLNGQLEPILNRLRAGIEELERNWALNSHWAGAGRRSGASRAKRVRIPRGALHHEIRKILARSKEPLRLTDIRDRLLRVRLFKERDPKTLYSQTIHAIRQMPDVAKVQQGRYGLKG